MKRCGEQDSSKDLQFFLEAGPAPGVELVEQLAQEHGILVTAAEVPAAPRTLLECF